jgi:uncharacterized protein YbbK (DUF523 family)
VAKVLISACLTGRACRFDGRAAAQPDLVDALNAKSAEFVSFCPEEAAGLGTPRPAARLQGGDGEAVVDGRARVITEEGDVTDAFLAGAHQAVACATREGCTVAYLKERSPSCGCAVIHTDDGLKRGCGVTAALLRRAGIATVSVS